MQLCRDAEREPHRWADFDHISHALPHFGPQPGNEHMFTPPEQENLVRNFVNVSKIAAVTAIALIAVTIPVASAGAATPQSAVAPAASVVVAQAPLSAGLPSDAVVQPQFLGDFAEAVASAVAGGVAGGIAGAWAAAQFAAPAAEVAAEVSSSSSSSSSGNAFNYNRNSATDSLDIQFDAATN